MRQICVDRYRYASCVAGLELLTATAFAQKDPGPRAGTPAAGGPVAGLTSDANYMAVFQKGSDQFQEAEAVADGLGPRFNSNSCSSCHSQPAVGGTSPARPVSKCVTNYLQCPPAQPLFWALENPPYTTKLLDG
jgi:hypothetical protein